MAALWDRSRGGVARHIEISAQECVAAMLELSFVHYSYAGREASRLGVYLRESNVLTSTIYRRNPDDSVFLFFTDDAVPPRPVFGALQLRVG